MAAMSEHATSKVAGPKMWVVSALAGALVGCLGTLVIEVGTTASGAPDVPLVLVVPFTVLLASIALMPFVNASVWHDHFPDFAFFLGSMVAVFYAVKLGSVGRGAMTHAMVEYYSFIALVGGLYVVSGGILIDFRGQGRPITNTLILAFGAVLANLVGTTGANKLERPVAVAVAEDGQLYVADGVHSAIMVFDKGERFSRSFEVEKLKPASLALSGDRLYVADIGRQQILVLDRGKVAGVYDKSQITMDQLIERLYHVASTGSLH